MKPMKASQKFQRPSRLAQHPPGDLREPIIDRAEQRKDRASDQDVMEVSHDKISIMHLRVEWHRGHHDAGQSPKHEIDDESKNEE